jgi:hypothetical protein
VANFYLVGALDAIEAEAYVKAESFIDSSARFTPNLPTQVALRRTIAKARQQPDFEQNRDYLQYYAGNDVYRARMKREEVAPVTAQQKPTSQASMIPSLTGMLPLLILVLVVAPLSILVVYNRYVADTKSLNVYTTETELELGESAIRHDAVLEKMAS